MTRSEPEGSADMRRYERYVAIGDSQTEGLNDGDEVAGYRGWADRLAERLARLNPDLRYANLAVRGRLAHQIRDQQLGPALALRPDLVTVVAGMNDLMRPRFDPALVAGTLEDMFAEVAAAGAHPATVTFPDIGRIAPIARPLRPRIIEMNNRIRAAARRHNVTILDTFHHPITADPRMWSIDRLHASPLGHARIAAAMAHALQLDGSDDAWAQPLPPLASLAPWRTLTAEIRWTRTFLLPWVRRRVTGRSTGDNRTPKRPTLTTITPLTTNDHPT